MNKTEFIQTRNAITQKPVTELLALLSSDDLQTRFFAEMALRDKTAT
jgi:hypothetical protein